MQFEKLFSILLLAALAIGTFATLQTITVQAQTTMKSYAISLSPIQ